MSLPYPLAMPPMPPGPKQITLAQNFIVAQNNSPFTAQQQIYEHQGSFWSVKVDLPYLTRAQASPWLAFLSALNGRSGTFLFGDLTVLGPLGNAAGSPFLNSAGQSGKTITIAALTGTLKAGDLFQIGGENRLLFSQAFENVVWSYGNCTRPTADTIVAPDGNTSAELLAFTGTGTGAFVIQTIAGGFFPGQTYTFSCWLKAPAGTPTLHMAVTDTNGAGATLVDTVFTMSGAWQRFSVQFTAISATSCVLLYSPSSATNFHAWGAQVELGVLPTMGVNIGSGPDSDYYPTLATPQTSTRRLHMNLGDISGNPCTPSIFPRLREVPVVGTFSGWLYFIKPQGQFRLDANLFQYAVDNAGHYSLSFGAVEAF